MMKVEQKKLSLRKNDQVQVMAGREKGKIGKILKVNSKTGRLTIENINRVKRHTRPVQGKPGGIMEKELPMEYSNVLLLCSKCNRGVRHGIKFVDQKKVRVCKRCDHSLDAVS
jgi:large subunit ribosomal protein L24